MCLPREARAFEMSGRLPPFPPPAPEQRHGDQADDGPKALLLSSFLVPSSTSSSSNDPTTPSEPLVGPCDDEIGNPMAVAARSNLMYKLDGFLDLDDAVPGEWEKDYLPKGETPLDEEEEYPPHLMSVGAAHHASGNCKPCLWLHSAQGCLRSIQCRFCHLSHAKQSRSRPSKGKRDSVKRRTQKALANNPGLAQLAHMEAQRNALALLRESQVRPGGVRAPDPRSSAVSTVPQPVSRENNPSGVMVTKSDQPDERRSSGIQL
eukprot:gnl/TRDRNA2_/TRDRNA2_131602_c3_seq2.p1 gnl/TRDRNA2_/TRDRNA2_131602_c3~~gnl/TRDRNA2_/TRDRNA2_131602_c3_seq2.p1  ORF type:complete len:276 (+),score=26.42 gnl/TRDRNA2_/TRDRNA2_131602_c3_seq2:40-828(+)